jgi:hypothetical protein
MKVPSNPGNAHLSLNPNCELNKQLNLSLPQQFLHTQQPPLTQQDTTQSNANPQKIKYGIQIITANPEDDISSSSSSLSNRQQNKALLGANLNPTINPPVNPVCSNLSNDANNNNSRSPRRPNYLQKSSFHNSLSPNPETRSKPAQIGPALSPIQQYYNALSPRGLERKNNSFYEADQDQDNKSNNSFNQDGPFLPRTKSNVDSKNCLLDSLNMSRDFDSNDYFVDQNVNKHFVLTHNKSNNDDNHGDNIRKSASNEFLRNKHNEFDNSQDDELFDNLERDLNSAGVNLFGGSVAGSEDGYFNKNNAYNIQPFVQVQVSNNKNSQQQTQVTSSTSSTLGQQQEQGITFNKPNNTTNSNISSNNSSKVNNDYMYLQQQPPQVNEGMPLGINTNMSNQLMNNNNNNANTNSNFNNRFTFNFPGVANNTTQNTNMMLNKPNNNNNNHLNYNMNLNISTNPYLNPNYPRSTPNIPSSRIPPQQQLPFNRNQPLPQQQQQPPQPTDLSSSTNQNYQRMLKPHNMHNLTAPPIYRLDNIEIAKQAHNLAKDQSGCRFLQKKIEEETQFALNCIYPVILDHLLDTVNDQFGNYLIQKFFEYLSPQEIHRFLNLIGPSFAPIGINQYGTRVLQKIIDFLPNDIDNLNLFKQCIIPNTVLFSNDVNGCHIIQKILTTKLFDNSFIYHQLDLHIEHIANHKNGCCFLQKCTEKLTGNELDRILTAIDKKAKILIIDQYGNYVIQHVMKINGAQRNYNLFMILISNLSYYSNQKFSSNVIEKFFLYDDFRRVIIEKMLNQQLMREMLFDGFGNYVVQRALANSNQEEQIQLLYHIAPLMEELKSLNFGAKLYHKLTTQYPMIINIMMNLRNSNE